LFDTIEQVLPYPDQGGAMSNKIAHCVLLAAGLILLAAVSGCAKQVTAGDADQGRIVELVPGESLVLTLESNPTTGYSWQLVEVDEAVLKPKGEPEFKPSSGSEGLVGAGGEEVFRFDAAGSGRTTLSLAYARPWEKDTPPLKTYTITVVVK
jgi:inhibitor of cysteine peptidase